MGVDPGINGALAVCDSSTGHLVSMEDMPVWYMTVGRSKRARVDAVELAERIDFAKNMLGVSLVVIEAVGGRPKQSASGGFVFGYTVGLLYMACVMHRLPIETVAPQTWKKLMKLPGKQRKRGDEKIVYATEADAKAARSKAVKDAEAAIVNRADEVFPASRELWRGPRGGLMLDRAEAALLARFGVDHVLRSLGHVAASDPEMRLAYRNADTGA